MKEDVELPLADNKVSISKKHIGMATVYKSQKEKCWKLKLIKAPHHCRDVIQNWWLSAENHQLRYLVMGVTDKKEAVVSYIKDVENILNLKEKTIIGSIKDKNAIWVRVSSFWLTSAMRKSIFTAFLKTGLEYNGNFQETNMNSEYFSTNQEHLDYFLAGHTETRFAIYSEAGWKQLCNEQKPNILML